MGSHYTVGLHKSGFEMVSMLALVTMMTSTRDSKTWLATGGMSTSRQSPSIAELSVELSMKQVDLIKCSLEKPLLMSYGVS